MFVSRIQTLTSNNALLATLHADTKMALILVLFGTLVVLFAVTRTATTAAAQTQAYYSFLRYWGARWPFYRGRGLPRRLRPILKPFVPVWVQVEPAIKMLLMADDLICRIILETGVWEESSWLAIQRHLSPGATFVDVGAHMGYFSLKAAAVVGHTGCVIAIEPNPEMVRILRGNILASGTSVVAIKPVACSHSDSVLSLFTAAKSNSGSSSLSKSNASLYGTGGSTYQVTARPLDTILKEAGVSRVDVLKIDVEGAELQVLKGAEETLAQYRPVLLVELDDQLLQSMGTSSAEVVAFLGQRGYTHHRSYDLANCEFIPDGATLSAASDR
jgi:FkbM family methyltransferase